MASSHYFQFQRNTSRCQVKNPIKHTSNKHLASLLRANHFIWWLPAAATHPTRLQAVPDPSFPSPVAAVLHASTLPRFGPLASARAIGPTMPVPLAGPRRHQLLPRRAQPLAALAYAGGHDDVHISLPSGLINPSVPGGRIDPAVPARDYTFPSDSPAAMDTTVAADVRVAHALAEHPSLSLPSSRLNRTQAVLAFNRFFILPPPLLRTRLRLVPIGTIQGSRVLLFSLPSLSTAWFASVTDYDKGVDSALSTLASDIHTAGINPRAPITSITLFRPFWLPRAQTRDLEDAVKAWTADHLASHVTHVERFGQASIYKAIHQILQAVSSTTHAPLHLILPPVVAAMSGFPAPFVCTPLFAHIRSRFSNDLDAHSAFIWVFAAIASITRRIYPQFTTTLMERTRWPGQLPLPFPDAAFHGHAPAHCVRAVALVFHNHIRNPAALSVDHDASLSCHQCAVTASLLQVFAMTPSTTVAMSYCVFCSADDHDVRDCRLARLIFRPPCPDSSRAAPRGQGPRLHHIGNPVICAYDCGSRGTFRCPVRCPVFAPPVQGAIVSSSTAGDNEAESRSPLPDPLPNRTSPRVPPAARPPPVHSSLPSPPPSATHGNDAAIFPPAPISIGASALNPDNDSPSAPLRTVTPSPPAILAAPAFQRHRSSSAAARVASIFDDISSAVREGFLQLDSQTVDFITRPQVMTALKATRPPRSQSLGSGHAAHIAESASLGRRSGAVHPPSTLAASAPLPIKGDIPTRPKKKKKDWKQRVSSKITATTRPPSSRLSSRATSGLITDRHLSQLLRNAGFPSEDASTPVELVGPTPTACNPAPTMAPAVIAGHHGASTRPATAPRSVACPPPSPPPAALAPSPMPTPSSSPTAASMVARASSPHPPLTPHSRDDDDASILHEIDYSMPALASPRYDFETYPDYAASAPVGHMSPIAYTSDPHDPLLTQSWVSINLSAPQHPADPGAPPSAVIQGSQCAPQHEEGRCISGAIGGERIDFLVDGGQAFNSISIDYLTNLQSTTPAAYHRQVKLYTTNDDSLSGPLAHEIFRDRVCALITVDLGAIGRAELPFFVVGAESPGFGNAIGSNSLQAWGAALRPCRIGCACESDMHLGCHRTANGSRTYRVIPTFRECDAMLFREGGVVARAL